jgi:hypothetical protein
MHSKSHRRGRRVAAWTTCEVSPKHRATVSPLYAQLSASHGADRKGGGHDGA